MYLLLSAHMHERSSGPQATNSSDLLGTKVGGVHIPQQAKGRPVLQPRGVELLIQLNSVPEHHKKSI